jgi:3-oxoacyl-[acyl-carrier-protein] synthase-1
MYSLVKSCNIIHPLGFSSQEVFDAIVEGKSGVKEIKKDYLTTQAYAAYFSEEQNDRLNQLCPFDGWNRFEKLIWLSGKKAIENVSITKNDKVLFIISTTKGGIEDIDTNADNLLIHSSVKKVIGRLLSDAPFYIISNACISGLSAIIAGKRFIETQDYNYVIIIGADTVGDFVLSGFNSLLALSDSPCRPFDKARKGINLGEGAASIVLQKSADSAKNEIYLTGGAITNDANHISGPSRTGMELCEAMRRAMRECGNAQFDFLSAHGTATVYNDEMESKAFTLAGLANVPVHSLKPYVGHTLGAAGVLESVICIKSLAENILIPSAGYNEQGTSCKLNIQTCMEKREMTKFIKTMSGFGGCNAAVCFEKNV